MHGANSLRASSEDESSSPPETPNITQNTPGNSITTATIAPRDVRRTLETRRVSMDMPSTSPDPYSVPPMGCMVWQVPPMSMDASIRTFMATAMVAIPDVPRKWRVRPFMHSIFATIIADASATGAPRARIAGICVLPPFSKRKRVVERALTKRMTRARVPAAYPMTTAAEAPVRPMPEWTRAMHSRGEAMFAPASARVALRGDPSTLTNIARPGRNRYAAEPRRATLV